MLRYSSPERVTGMTASLPTLKGVPLVPILPTSASQVMPTTAEPGPPMQLGLPAGPQEVPLPMAIVPDAVMARSPGDTGSLVSSHSVAPGTVTVFTSIEVTLADAADAAPAEAAGSMTPSRTAPADVTARRRWRENTLIVDTPILDISPGQRNCGRAVFPCCRYSFSEGPLSRTGTRLYWHYRRVSR